MSNTEKRNTSKADVERLITTSLFIEDFSKRYGVSKKETRTFLHNMGDLLCDYVKKDCIVRLSGLFTVRVGTLTGTSLVRGKNGEPLEFARLSISGGVRLKKAAKTLHSPQVMEALRSARGQKGNLITRRAKAV